MTKATVVAPMLETVVSIKGTSTSDQAGYLWFQGITFAHSTFMRPSQSGFCDAQAGQYNLTATSDNKQTIGRPPAGVSVMNANHVHFERNIFTQMGATGLDFISGTHDDMIIGNVVTEIAGNGISIGKFAASDTTEYHIPYNPTDKNEICTNDTIKDNYIHHVTTEFQGGTGIAAGYPKQIDIEHNEVAYTNYTAISVGYGWTSSVNAMATNKINNNDIHHAVQILADGAGIYTLSNQQPNSQMQYNYLHDYQTSQWADYGSLGIYLDEQTSGYTIAHNAMVNAPVGRRAEPGRHEHHHRHARRESTVGHVHGGDRGRLRRHQEPDHPDTELLTTSSTAASSTPSVESAPGCWAPAVPLARGFNMRLNTTWYRARRMTLSAMALAIVIVAAIPSPARADNPIVQTSYTADPAPMVYDGTLYLYTSHDDEHRGRPVHGPAGKGAGR